MKLILAVAGILIVAAPLMAETYRWEDETGAVNFTENYTSIPAKFRKKARKLGDMGSDPSSAPPAAVSGAKATPAVRATAEAGAGSADDANGLFGGRKPEAWQQEMRPLYAEVKRLELQLGELELLLRKPTGISKSRIDGLPQEYMDTKNRYNQAVQRYNSLNDEANKAALPAEFRK